MNIREADKKKDVSGGKEREEGKKPGKMLDALKSIGATPLKSTIMAVATTAVLGCGSSLSTNKDTDEDAETDAPLVANIPRPPIEVQIPVPRDSETDGDVAEDAVEDGEIDVPEDVLGEEVVASCDAFDDAKYSTMLNTGFKVPVGGVDVRYDGVDEEGKGMFSLLCDDVLVAQDAVGAGETKTINIDSSTTVELSPSLIHDSYARLNIRVDV